MAAVSRRYKATGGGLPSLLLKFEVMRYEALYEKSPIIDIEVPYYKVED